MNSKYSNFQSILVLFAIFFAVSGYAQGIKFQEGSWADVQKKAKAEKKMIFVDAYAEWCGPCKWMSKNAFVDDAVGKLFNKYFVSYKFDMEKGEGPAFARQNQINAYPTLLYFDSNGKLIQKSAGALNPAQLLEQGDKIVKQKK